MNVRPLAKHLPSLRSVLAALMLICAWSASAPASAQSINLPIQGYLTDDAGVPMEGSQGITVALYSAPTGGTPVYAEGGTVEVTAGVFTHYVGETSPLDAALFANGVSLWVGVSIGGGGELSPRVAMGWVPYAAWAANADDATTVGGMAPSSFASATPGAGLSGSGASLSVDTTTIQSRVVAECPAGQSIRAIHEDGTVTCEADVDTARGVTFTRWGRGDCPTGTSLVYSGYGAGADYTGLGNGTNILCLAGAPSWGMHNDADDAVSEIRGLQYNTGPGTALGPDFSGVELQDALCAVCIDDSADNQFMFPGSQTCPTGWNTRVSGYLMGAHVAHHPQDYICVDEMPAGRTGSVANEASALLYPVEVGCQNLPCGPYVQDRELTCSICTR